MGLDVRHRKFRFLVGRGRQSGRFGRHFARPLKHAAFGDAERPRLNISVHFAGPGNDELAARGDGSINRSSGMYIIGGDVGFRRAPHLIMPMDTSPSQTMSPTIFPSMRMFPFEVMFPSTVQPSPMNRLMASRWETLRLPNILIYLPIRSLTASMRPGPRLFAIPTPHNADAVPCCGRWNRRVRSFALS